MVPEVESGGEGLVAFFLVQASEGVDGQAASGQMIQVAVPLDLNADHAPLATPKCAGQLATLVCVTLFGTAANVSL